MFVNNLSISCLYCKLLFSKLDTQKVKCDNFNNEINHVKYKKLQNHYTIER